MTLSEQLRLLSEGAHERRPALRGTQVASHPGGEVAEILSAVARHGMALQIPQTYAIVDHIVMAFL